MIQSWPLFVNQTTSLPSKEASWGSETGRKTLVLSNADAAGSVTFTFRGNIDGIPFTPNWTRLDGTDTPTPSIGTLTLTAGQVALVEIVDPYDSISVTPNVTVAMTTNGYSVYARVSE